MTESFENFLSLFVPQYEKKFTQANKAAWLLETTGAPDAVDLKSDLDAELRILFSHPEHYHLLQTVKKNPPKSPLLQRQLTVLLHLFQQNQIDPKDLEELSKKEALLSQSYALFRAELEGKRVSENEIREILKTEKDVAFRRKTWEASKAIGEVLARQIIEIVLLRNTCAKKLGFPDFFQMQLELQEVDGKWLSQIFERFFEASEPAYAKVFHAIEEKLAKRFHVPKEEIGPWAWSDPFSQEDPLDVQELDTLVQDVDIIHASVSFFDRMGVDVRPILARSDMEERPGKSQHAFCMHVDRNGDVRTLNNVRKSIKWLETVLHEFGHAIYDVGIDRSLPWVLREPPHMITTEAMALLMGRQAYLSHTLPLLVGESLDKKKLIEKADQSLQRRQLIFSRWVLVMTAFEKELYRDPMQDLNALWWDLVEKYQKIRPPAGRKKGFDWAAKYHIGLAPVYYFSYLLGEMFASSIQQSLKKEAGTSSLATKEAGRFLQKKLFSPGNSMDWNSLVQHVTGAPLDFKDYLQEFSS